MVGVLLGDRADILRGGWAECVDLDGSARLSGDEEVDQPTLAHVALHSGGPGITPRTVAAEAHVERVELAAEISQRLEQVRSVG